MPVGGGTPAIRSKEGPWAWFRPAAGGEPRGPGTARPLRRDVRCRAAQRQLRSAGGQRRQPVRSRPVPAPALSGRAPTMAVGLLGKLPSHGDLPAPRVAAELAIRSTPGSPPRSRPAASALGEGWLYAYLTAPVWRFALAARRCGPRRRRHLAAQRRSRRRYYPLLAVTPLGGDAVAGDAAAGWPRVVRSRRGAGLGRAGRSSEPPRARGGPGRDRAAGAVRDGRAAAVAAGAGRPGRLAAGGAGADRQPVVGPGLAARAGEPARLRRAAAASRLRGDAGWRLSPPVAGRGRAHDRLSLGGAQPCRPRPQAQRGQRRSPGPSAACGRWPTAWAGTRAATSPASWSPRRLGRAAAEPTVPTICCAAVQAALGQPATRAARRGARTVCRLHGRRPARRSTGHFACLWAGDSRALPPARRRADAAHPRPQPGPGADRPAASSTPEAARTHPWRNRITRAVGIDERLELDGLQDRLEPGDRVSAVQRRADRGAGGRGDRGARWRRRRPRPLPSGCWRSRWSTARATTFRWSSSSRRQDLTARCQPAAAVG